MDVVLGSVRDRRSQPESAGAGAFTYNLRLPGQIFHGPAGLHYNDFRDYDPAIGRYIEPDPIGLRGGINAYAYVGDDAISEIDPLGLDWEFSQSTGQWTHIDNQTGARQPLGQGYSGNGAGHNNSAMQNSPNVGPIPQGTYSIGQAYHNQHTGPVTMNLNPVQNTNTFGRNLFRIHGDNATHNASNGCPIAPPAVRQQISNSTDRILHVVP